MSGILHLSTDIEGFLRIHKHDNLDGMIVNTETGVAMADFEARQYLFECLGKGYKVLPMGDCPTFDYQTGCNCRRGSSEVAT